MISFKIRMPASLRLLVLLPRSMRCFLNASAHSAFLDQNRSKYLTKRGYLDSLIGNKVLKGLIKFVNVLSKYHLFDKPSNYCPIVFYNSILGIPQVCPPTLEKVKNAEQKCCMWPDGIEGISFGRTVIS